MKESTGDAPPFLTSAEHLDAELDWLDGALLALVRSSRQESHRDGHGWFVSTEEAESLLTSGPPAGAGQSTCRSLQRKRRQITARVQASLAGGVHLTLPHVGRLFRLGAAEERLLVACLAAEREEKYGRIFGYLHDDLTRKQPSIHVAGQLVRLEAPSRWVDALTPSLTNRDLPLFRWELVCNDTTSGLGRSARGWWIDQRIAAYLLEQDQELQAPLRMSTDVPELAPATEDVEREIWNLIVDRQAGLVVHFRGPGRSDGEAVAQRICNRLDVQLLRVDLDALLDPGQPGAGSVAETVRKVYREALLRHAAVYLSGFERLGHESGSGASVRAFEDVVQDVLWLTFVEGEPSWLPQWDASRMAFLPCNLAAPSVETRQHYWRAHLGHGTEPRELDALAAKYRFTSRNILRAVQLAGTRAAAQQRERPLYADLQWACRLHSTRNLHGLARTITPRVRWDDLVVQDDVLQQLRDMCAQARHRPRVLHAWGFDRLLSTGKGLYALFAGPSGTGKTLAAEVLASALDVDLLTVDLSSVVSKYIGDTEKNLERIFDATERADAILFFDEADAMFGKRSEVKDAHDRYANIEVAFLLQRLEAYEGVVILASNLAGNIDAAFARRMTFMLEFPFPDESMRFGIWRRHLPPEMPIASDVDLAWLSRELKIAGGNIRNITFNAAFMAADEGDELRMCHVLRAARREYVRLGKVYRFPAATAVEEACG